MKCGVLRRQSRILKRWSRRWFVLRASVGLFVHYKTKCAPETQLELQNLRPHAVYQLRYLRVRAAQLSECGRKHAFALLSRASGALIVSTRERVDENTGCRVDCESDSSCAQQQIDRQCGEFSAAHTADPSISANVAAKGESVGEDKHTGEEEKKETWHYFAAESREECSGWILEIQHAIEVAKRGWTEDSRDINCANDSHNDGKYADSCPSEGNARRFTLHRAVFRDDVEALLVALHDPDVAVDEADLHGNSPLHVAIMLGRIECANVLVSCGHADPSWANVTGWSPLQEAVSFGNRETIRFLLIAQQRQRQQWFLGVLPDVMRHISALGDFTMRIRWRFDTWIPLMQRLCPSDDYVIYKRTVGDTTSVRIDSTIVGFKRMQWQRGNMSMLCVAQALPSSLNIDYKLIDRVKRTVHPIHTTSLSAGANDARDFDARREVLTPKEEANLQLDVDLLMQSIISASSPPDKVVFKERPDDLSIGGRRVKLFTVKNLKVLVRKRSEHLSVKDIRRRQQFKASLRDPQKMYETIAEELDREDNGNDEGNQTSPDIETTVPSCPSATEIGADGELMTVDSSRHCKQTPERYKHRASLEPPRHAHAWTASEYFSEKVHKKFPQWSMHLGRPMRMKVTTHEREPRLYMSDTFPLSLASIRALLRLVTVHQRHAETILNILDTQLPPGFPVRMQLPVFTGVTMSVTCCDFKKVDSMPAALFKVPADYTVDVDRFA